MAKKKKTAAPAPKPVGVDVDTTAASPAWISTLRQVLQDVQSEALEATAYQSKAHITNQATVRRLTKVWTDVTRDKTKRQLFIEELWLAIGRVLVTAKLKDIVVVAMASFLGDFLHTKERQANKTRELRQILLVRLVSASKTDDKSIRIRACQMLQLMLNKLDYIEEEVFTQVRDGLLLRAIDKVVTVRIHTVLALKKLQEPNEAEKDIVTQELLRLLNSDPSKEVRQAALQSLAVTSTTSKDLLLRIRDVSPEVRVTAFEVFGGQHSLQEIPINDRAHLLDQGLQDRSEKVRIACEQMILKKWLPACDGSPVALLKTLDIEQSQELGSRVAKLVLKHLAEQPTLKQESVAHNALEILAANQEAIDAESIFFWKEQCHYYQKIDHDPEKLAVLLPNVTDFSTLLVAMCKAGPEMLFIAQQLLALGQLLDFQDEFGRRNLLDRLQTMLRNLDTDSNLIAGIMELVACIYASSSEQEFIQVIAEIISDVYDPLEDENSQPDQHHNMSEEELTEATNRFEQLEKQLDSLDLDSPEYNQVQNEMLELEKVLQDPQVLHWLRCLEIVAQLLKLTASTLSNPTVAGMSRYILPAIECDVPALRESGMECLGLFCLFDRKVAERHMIVFWRALNNAEEEREVKLNCIGAIFDMTFSFANLQPQVVQALKKPESDENEDAGAEKVMPVLEKLDMGEIFMGLAELLVTTDDLDMQSIIVEGFGKLFLMNRIKNTAVLAILLETYFSPKLLRIQSSSEHGYQSRSLQILSVFFPTYVATSTFNCTLLEEAVSYLLHRSMEKEDIESENAIDLVVCTKYVLHLLSHTEANEPLQLVKGNDVSQKQQKQRRCAHQNRIGINICMDILALEHILSTVTNDSVQPEVVSARFKILVKMLVLTDISVQEPRSAALFKFLLTEIVKTCFASQQGLHRNVDLFLKKSLAAFDEQMQSTTDDLKTEAQLTVLKQDQEWAQERIQERHVLLQQQLEEVSRKEEEIRKQKQRKAANKRRSRYATSSSESDSEDESANDDDETNKPAVPARRELSSRRSKTAAVDRMKLQEQKIIIVDDDDDDDMESESEEESEDEESSADEYD